MRLTPRRDDSGSKAQRFLEVQPYIASKRVSITRGARHTDLVLNHISKITANDTHRHDDIMDTLVDAIRLSLIDKTITNTKMGQTDYNELAKNLTFSNNQANRLRKAAYS